MKKSDLKYGNIVETRNGNKWLFSWDLKENKLIDLTGSKFITFDNYREDLTNINNAVGSDIMKVYKDYTCKELLWERKEKPKLNEDERSILWNLSEEYKWIVRNESGLIYLFTNKPFKALNRWVGYDPLMFPFEHIFKFIKWEDEEPYSIEELLKGE